MGIDLTNAIVIIDEAHNIEDVSRAAGSLEVSLEQMAGKARFMPAIQKELVGLLAEKATAERPFFPLADPEAHSKLLQFCLQLSGWMENASHKYNKVLFDKKMKM
jgi:Rad3-related DNA helicase